MQKEFETPEPIQLELSLSSGRAEVTAAEVERTTVEIEGPRADEFTVELRGTRLVVSSPRHRFLGGNDDHQVRIEMPTESAAELQTGSADLRISGRLTVVRAKTGSGYIDVDSVTGPVTLDSGSGNLTCAEVGGRLRAKTGSGDLEIGECHAEMVISTGSGDVTVGRSDAGFTVKTGSGDVVVRRAAGGEINYTGGSGSLSVDHLERGGVRAKTGSGDISVGITAGTPVWTEANSVTGRVRSELPPVGKPEEGQDHLELRLQTGTGDITLRQV